MSNIYNNEEKEYAKIIEDLKGLPKIQAPENFEFNLMTRIENKNFGLTSEKETKLSLYKFFAPSAAVVAVILLFIIFFPQREQLQKEITTHQKNIDSQSIVSNSNIDNGTQSTTSQPKANSVIPRNKSIAAEESRIEAQPSKARSIINSDRAIAVDDYISGREESVNKLGKGTIVKDGQVPITDGFLIEKKTDKATLERYRAIVDSVKKAQLRADSLKRVQK